MKARAAIVRRAYPERVLTPHEAFNLLADENDVTVVDVRTEVSRVACTRVNPSPFLHSSTRYNVLCSCCKRLSVCIDVAFNLLADEKDVTVVDVRTEVIHEP